ncbi:MAG: hypothetical protein AVDCRST_MAG48-627, partial [uncultured Friedmanniella sp.]
GPVLRHGLLLPSVPVRRPARGRRCARPGGAAADAPPAPRSRHGNRLRRAGAARARRRGRRRRRRHGPARRRRGGPPPARRQHR